jgi:hypothetical protein
MHSDKINNIVIPYINYPLSYHIKHHLDVKYNMELNKNYVNNLDGLYFIWSSVVLLSIFAYLIYYVIIKVLFKYDIENKYILLLAISVLLLYRLIWNYIHPKMHQLSKEKIEDMNFIEKFLFKNHAYHHLQKGDKKGNYNIVVVGADHLFNDYNKCIDNKEYCKKNYNKLNKDSQELCDLERNNKKLKHGLKFCK